MKHGRIASTLIGAGALLLAAAPATAQVAVQQLGKLDLFSTGATDTGLGADLWKGASADIAREVIPGLAQRPLSPAAAALARRVLSTAAAAPDGAGSDTALAGARAQTLLALGDAADAQAILDHTSNLNNDGALSQVAAEAALIAGNTDRACATADALTADRGGVYWLRLRAFCQARAGQTAAAQLTFDLAQEQGRDATYARLMGAVMGGGDPGAGSLRNGLDYALTTQLKLEPSLTPDSLEDAEPAIRAKFLAAGAFRITLVDPAVEPQAAILGALRRSKTVKGFVAAATEAEPKLAALVQANTPLLDPILMATAAVAASDLPTAQAIRVGLMANAPEGDASVDLALLDALLAASAGKAEEAALGGLIDHAFGPSKIRCQAGAGLLAALGTPMSGEARAAFAKFELGKQDASDARLLAMDLAADAGRKGEAALLALYIAQAGPAQGPAPADRARIVRALSRAGLKTDARAFAVEGLLALSPSVAPPPAPAKPAAKPAKKPAKH